MKKNLFYYAFAVICAMSVFTSCSDDDDVNPILGTWGLSQATVNENDVYTGNGPLAMSWTTPDGTEVLGMTTPDFAEWIESLGSALLPQVLKDITFKEDGNIIATYSNTGVDLSGTSSVTPVWQTSEPEYATFKMSGNNQILVFLNLENIMAQASSKADASDLLPILNLVKEGIPVSYEMSVDGKNVRFFIDKTLVDKVSPLLSLLSGVELPDMGGMEALVPIIIGQITEALKVTNKIEIGLRLTK
ncbi:DUF4925 domain-containing protein [Phocaeicola sp.]